MIQITPQMRILVAVEPADFRNYVQFAYSTPNLPLIP